MYHTTSFKLDLEKLPSPSSSIHLHIQLAYLQCQLWVIAAAKQLTLDPCDYGYAFLEIVLVVSQPVRAFYDIKCIYLQSA